MECKGCEKGIAMCHHRPCMGSPEEFEAIIDAGFAEKLRIDWWYGHHDVAPPTHEDLENAKDPLEKLLLQTIFALKGKSKDSEPNPFRDNVEFLSGGTENDKNWRADFIPTGTCKFLTKDSSCELHSLGLKPSQGKIACCKVESSAADGNLTYIKLWATDKGKEVIEKFKKAVNYVGT